MMGQTKIVTHCRGTGNNVNVLQYIDAMDSQGHFLLPMLWKRLSKTTLYAICQHLVTSQPNRHVQNNVARV